MKTSNEEIDVVIYHDREFFLVECKWEKEPLETKEIGAFYSKLAKREGVKGVIVSMSGFTKGALKEVLSHMGDRAMLLIGPADISSLVDQNVSLEESINEKYTQLVTKLKVLVA